MEVRTQKHTRCFCYIVYKTKTDSDKFLYLFATNYYKCFPPHLNNAYLVKRKIRVFVKIVMLEKRNSRCYIFTLILLIGKYVTLWLWHHVMANLIRKTCTKPYQNRPRFADMTKTFGVFFLSLIHIWRCRRIERCRSRWSPYH